MDILLSYIQNNIVLIIILVATIPLAIIGYYADKTNFGQKKDSKEDEPMNQNLLERPIADALGVPSSKNEPIKQKKTQNEQKKVEDSKEINVEILPVEQEEEKNKEKQEKPKEVKKTKEKKKYDFTILKDDSNDSDVNNFVNNSSKTKMFDNEFDSVIPKKNFLTQDLLSDIENLSLDKTQKLELSDIPDLDDIDLPKIKKMSDDDEDIWKL